MRINIHELAWEKMNGLLPAVVQDAKTNEVLMLGFMNKDALCKTLETNLLTFYSRSKKRLWVKGETSGNKLELINIQPDCDKDTLLIIAQPSGPVCHAGTPSCFNEVASDWEFIQTLEAVIDMRDQFRSETSYTSQLFASGINRIAQKVGEESIGVVLAAIDKDNEDFAAEVADLFFHVLVLIKARKLSLAEIISVLKERSQMD